MHVTTSAAGKERERQRLRPVLCALIVALAAASNYPLVRGQFHADDEAMQAWTCTKILNHLENWQGKRTVAQIVWLFTFEHHPPLRFLLSLPGMALLPRSECGPRLMSILFSLYMTYEVMRLGCELGGPRVAYASGALVACSAVFNWTSAAFGWSVMVVMLLIALRLLRKASLDITLPAEVGILRRINLLLIVAFLMNTSSILFFFSTILVYVTRNHCRLRLLLKLILPFLAFYAAYYAWFFWLGPLAAHRIAGAVPLGGQLLQTVGRGRAAHLNVGSFLENLKGLNGHYLPYISLLLFALGFWRLLVHERRALLWLAPFLAMWSFYLAVNTQQYFVLASVCLLPFGVKELAARLKPRAFVALTAMGALAFGAWNYAMFVRTYGEADYPQRLLNLGWASRGYLYNVAVPYRQMGRDIDKLIGPGERFVDDVSGSFSMFYYKEDPREYRHSQWAGWLGSKAYPVSYDAADGCYRLGFDAASEVRLVATRRPLCPSQVETAISYPGSLVKVYLLKRKATSVSRGPAGGPESSPQGWAARTRGCATI